MKFTQTLLFFFCGLTLLIGQEKEPLKFSLDYKESTAKEVLEKIETKTPYRFYFLESWLDNTKHTGSYKNQTLESILDVLFKSTILNYYITDENKVVLSQNSLIYRPDLTGLFKKPTTNDRPKQNVIVAKQGPLTPVNTDKIYRIGKETLDSKNKRYTLSGKVINSTTNEPISDLVVTIGKQNVVTDKFGAYKFLLSPGVYTLETKAIGITNTKKTLVLYNSGTLNIGLEESSEFLDEVVINADRDKNIKEVTTSVTQIKAEDIKTIPLILGERDILKVATTLPGIKTAGEGAMGFSVRGGKTDQNLILLDDGVVYNPTHFFGIFSGVNPFTTGTVKIYKGSAPAEYGGRLSSVIDISTKTGSNEAFKGEASIGPVTSNITLETPVIKDKSSIIVGARGTYSNWILKSLDDTSLDNSQASFFDVISKYTHKLNDKNSIEATGYYSYDDYKITSDSLNSYSNSLVSLKWKHNFNEKTNSTLLLANSQYQFNIDYDKEGGASNFNLNYSLNETHLKLKIDYRLNEKHKFDYGISTKLYNVNPGSKTPKDNASLINPVQVQKERALESALFFSDDYKMNDKFLINLGLRYSLYASLGKGTRNIYDPSLPISPLSITEVKTYDNNEVIQTYSGLGLKASARYAFTPTFSLKASFNNSFQYIQSLSNNTTASPTDTWRLSDNNIKPQESTQVTLGAYQNLGDDLYEISVEGYYKTSKNILDYKIGADLLINPTIETEVLQGVGKAYGVEFLLKKKTGKLNGWLGYTYSRTYSKFDSNFAEEKINNGDYFPSNIDKPHDLSLVLNYKMTKRFSWSMNFAYQTGRPVTYPVGKYNYNGSQYVFYSDHNKFRIPDYYRMDIGLNIEGNHKIKKFAHSFWNISIYNVLGRNNPYSVFFVTKDGKINAYKSSIFSVPVPTITYNFKF
ncbi:TonB-dependent receptor [Polaribacter pacificus]|uniref:TonB-dependent receptor n=1 Tax=Polaribacter pacificus TaxID=1775173 RepID=A0A917ME09_9FLAO|nr:TonB-dependent receptor [Polaribacter pacificus]GGG98608.1 TonB-dependent receptor [Polaribacter pacificus]